MNETDFISGVIGLYQSARRIKPAHRKISRGRSRPTPPLLEDLFAAFLVSKVKCDHVYVDQPISIPGYRQIRYPDITIVRHGEMFAFCDLKTDMGWHRDGLGSLCKRHYQWLHAARGKKARLRDGVTKEQKMIKISSKAIYNIVILHEHNINSESLNRQIAAAKRKYSGSIDIFVLTEGRHPNDYDTPPRTLRNEIVMKQPDLRTLIHKIRTA